MSDDFGNLFFGSEPDVGRPAGNGRIDRVPVDAKPERVEALEREHGRIDECSGVRSLIHGSVVPDGARQALAALNRRRMGQAKSAAAALERGGQGARGLRPVTVASVAADFGIPVVGLPALGIECDASGVLHPRGEGVRQLKPGMEAQPFHHVARQVVYKVFAPDDDGTFGKMLTCWTGHGGEWQVRLCGAPLEVFLHKLNLLHEIGGTPTEIIGITPHGQWLSKQPEATHIPPAEFAAARAEAVALAGGVRLNIRGLDDLRLVWHEDRAWLISDLHSKNVMRDAAGVARIMDACICPVPERMIYDHPEVRQAIEDARRKADTGSQLCWT